MTLRFSRGALDLDMDPEDIRWIWWIGSRSGFGCIQKFLDWIWIQTVKIQMRTGSTCMESRSDLIRKFWI